MCYPFCGLLLVILMVIPFIRTWLRHHTVVCYGIILFMGLAMATVVFLDLTNEDVLSVISWRPSHQFYEDEWCVIPPWERATTPCPPTHIELVGVELTLRARTLPRFAKACYSDDQSFCVDVDQRIQETGGAWTDFRKNSLYSVMACAGTVLGLGLIATGHKKKIKRDARLPAG